MSLPPGRGTRAGAQPAPGDLPPGTGPWAPPGTGAWSGTGAWDAPQDEEHGPGGEEGDELRAVLSAVRRRWPILVAAVALSTAIAAARTLQEPAVFAATARMQLAKEAPDPAAAKYTTYWEGIQLEYMNTQIRILGSATLAAGVLEANPQIARELAADASAASPDGAAPGHDALAYHFLGGVGVAPVKDTYLVDITYESTEPDRCARYANALAQAYIEQLDEQAGRRTRITEEKVGEQTELLLQKLERSERELREFLEGNQTPLFERHEELLIGRVAANNEALAGVQRERIRLDAELEAVNRVVEQGRPLESAPAIARNELVIELRRQLAQAELDVTTLGERYGEGWPAVQAGRSRRDQLKLLLRQEMDTLRGRLQAERDAKTREEQGLLERARQLHEEARDLSKRRRLYDSLRGEVEANRRFYEEFATRLKEVSAYSRVNVSNVRVIDRAAGARRVRPNHGRNIAMGAMLGVGVAAGLIFLLERLADRIRTVADAARALRLPVLGVIPEVRELDGARLDLYAVTRPHSVYAEAFRKLYVQLNAVGGLPADAAAVLLVTSGLPEEGKTACSINLAIASANAGKRTLLVDGDLRGPRLHRTFDVEARPGLAEVLTQKALWGAVVRPTQVSNLSIMTAGKAVENPGELLARTDAFADLLERLRGHFDRIVLDSPPAAAVTDAALMAPFADAALLVVSARRSSRGASTLAKTELVRVGAPPTGVLVNHHSDSETGAYYHRYYRRYDPGHQTRSAERPSGRDGDRPGEREVSTPPAAPT